ncbi:hypothetical protein H2248_002919 [Termitomyces sp. 'cryptogamus']|nr:hypothetical protein H2248_002919 [Termitomyces sp. 'cryptogamus']
MGQDCHMEVTEGNTMGAAFIGTMIAAILYGLTNLQVYIYYQNYRNDWRIHKYSVAFLWVMDTFHVFLTISAVYHYLVNSFGSVQALQLVVWSLKLGITVNVIVVVVVQSLYALRVWKLGRHYHLIWPMIVAMIVASGYAIGIVLAIKTYGLSTFADLSTMSWVVYASFAWITGIDVVIAITMCFYLTQSRSEFSKTNSKIVFIMQMVLISGFLTSACSLMALITFATMPDTLVFLGITFILTRLYINSFLAMLNVRKTVCEIDIVTGPGSVPRFKNIQPTSSHIQSNELSSSHSLEEGKTMVPPSSLSSYRNSKKMQSKGYNETSSIVVQHQSLSETFSYIVE